MLVVTTDSVPGFEIRQVYGEIVGLTARSHNVFIEGVKALDGRLNPEMAASLTRWRDEAVGRMIAAAERSGANAIVGMRFDNRQVSDYWTEICAYGTAVFVTPAGLEHVHGQAHQHVREPAHGHAHVAPPGTAPHSLTAQTVDRPARRGAPEVPGDEGTENGAHR